MKWYKITYIVVDRGNNGKEEDITIYYTFSKRKYLKLIKHCKQYKKHYENIILNLNDAFHFVWKYGRDIPQRKIFCNFF